ncbi:MAG: hypothetical protein IKL79_04620 [Clostridia bacterium]|nr:hypothetical protein [Clostridia bacterium]
MKNFKRLLVVLALVFALSLGVLTTAFANADAQLPEGGDAESGNTEIAPDEGSGDGSEGDGENSDREQILADRLAAIEANTPLKQYDLPVIQGPLTWENGRIETTSWKQSGADLKASWGQMLGNVGVNDFLIEYEENGNAYFTVRYHGEAEKEYEEETGKTLHSYPYIDVNPRVQENNLVIDFDITCFGDAYPKMGIEHSTVDKDGGGRAQPRILEIQPDGSISPSFGSGNCQSGHKITEEENEKVNSIKLGFGEWTHITLVYESDTCFVSLYVDYEFICRYDTRPVGVSQYELKIFRYGTANSDYQDGEVSIDNFVAYEGSYIRTPDLFENMTAPDKFIFYSGYAINTSAPNSDRVTAYKLAQNLVEKYYKDGEFVPAELDGFSEEELAALNERLEMAVNSYNAFIADGYEELYTTYITNNLSEYGRLVQEFYDTQIRTLASLEDRRAALAVIDAFLKDCGDDILKSEDSDFLDVKTAYDGIVAQITNDSNILTFIGAVEKFYAATKFSAEVIQKHYNNIQTVYQTITDNSVLNAEGFEEYKNAYELYGAAAEILSQKLREKNSKVIVECIAFIDEYTTQEQWEANSDYINKYVLIVREIVKDRDENGELKYDESYEGVVEAVEFFAIVDEYFYGILQRQHADYINELLERYLAATGYVEKVGICAHIRAYIANADISLEHELVAPAVTRLAIYESELEQYRDDYNDVLTQNTTIFKNTVNLMSTAGGYAELLELYNKAQELYFAMNVGDESIARELAIFDEMTFTLEAMRAASNEFIVSVELLRAAVTEEEKYLALVECAFYAGNADTDYAGVTEAMEYYLSEYNAYNGVATAIISEIESMTNAAVASVRANCGVNEIIAVIVKKITEEN